MKMKRCQFRTIANPNAIDLAKAVVTCVPTSSRDPNIDLWEVIGTAPSQPDRFQSFRIDPNNLPHNARPQLDYPSRHVEPAEEINTSIPAHPPRRVQGSAEHKQHGTSRRTSPTPTPISSSKPHHA